MQALATTFFGGDDPFSPFFGSDRSIVRAIAGTGDERQLRGISLDVVEVSAREAAICRKEANDKDVPECDIRVPGT